MKRIIYIMLAIISIISIRMIYMRYRIDIIRLTLHTPVPDIIKSILWGWF